MRHKSIQYDHVSLLSSKAQTFKFGGLTWISVQRSEEHVQTKQVTAHSIKVGHERSGILAFVEHGGTKM